MKLYYKNSDIWNINLIAFSSVCIKYGHPACDASAELLINALLSRSEMQEFYSHIHVCYILGSPYNLLHIFRTILQLTLSVIIDLTIFPHLSNAPVAQSILKTYISFIKYNQFYTNHVVQGNEM